MKPNKANLMVAMAATTAQCLVVNWAPQISINK